MWMPFLQAMETFSGERISYSLGSADSLQLDQVQKLNQRRMRMLDDMSEKDRRSGEGDREKMNSESTQCLKLQAVCKHASLRNRCVRNQNVGVQCGASMVGLLPVRLSTWSFTTVLVC